MLFILPAMAHGKQDVNDPLESGLILHSAIQLKVKEIMKQFTPNASLAFLSACETAMGAENLPDEAVHLAASLLFAGFRGVVATMW
jgi:CHAT domain-containing protein